MAVLSRIYLLRLDRQVTRFTVSSTGSTGTSG